MNTQEIIDHYVFIGFSRDMISLAMADSRTGTFEDIGKLLVWNKEEYAKSIAMGLYRTKQGKGPQKIFYAPKQDKKMKKNGKAIKKSDDRQEMWETMKAQGSKNYKEKKKGKDKQMADEDELEADDLQAMIKLVKKVSLDVTNRNLLKVMGNLKMAFFEKDSILVKEFGGQFFTMLEKTIRLKIDSSVKIDKSVLEHVLSISFEMKIMTENQMNSLLSSYLILCEKPENIAEANIIRKLKEYCNDEGLKNIIPKSSKKLEILENKDEGEKGQEKDLSEEEMMEANEECLICMINVREIVFLPCCHFLTCSLCSGKVNKCPLCNKDIEQSLKIYWS